MQREKGGNTMRTAIIAAIVAMLVSAASATAAFVVTSKNIKNGTIQLVDISPRAKAALRGQRGSRGEPGVIASVTETAPVRVAISSGASGTARVDCPAGLGPISGGYFWFPFFGSASGVSILSNRRTQSKQGWEVNAENRSGDNLWLYVVAYCAPRISGA